MLNKGKLAGKVFRGPGGSSVHSSTPVFHNATVMIGTNGQQTGGSWGGFGGGFGATTSKAEPLDWVGNMVRDLMTECFQGAGQQAAKDVTDMDRGHPPPGTFTEEMCAGLWKKAGLTSGVTTPQDRMLQVVHVYQRALADAVFREKLLGMWQGLKGQDGET